MRMTNYKKFSGQFGKCWKRGFQEDSASHYDRMVDFGFPNVADPGARAATHCGADRRCPCAAGLGGDCRSHHGHSPGAHLKTTSEQIVDVHMPQVMEKIIEVVNLIPRSASRLGDLVSASWGCTRWSWKFSGEMLTVRNALGFSLNVKTNFMPIRQKLAMTPSSSADCMSHNRILD